MRQSGTQLLFGNHRKAMNTRIHEKALKSRDTRRGQRLNPSLVVFDDSTPGHPVDPASAYSCTPLGFERADVSRPRQTIQRHVDEHRVAPGCGAARPGFKSFPFRATRIVEM